MKAVYLAKKMRLSLILLLLANGVAGLLFGQVTMTLTSVPADTPPGATIHAAGNFNGWDPGDAAYVFEEADDGAYELTFDPAPGTLEFKFTRGSWDTVEGNASGGYLPNRTLAYDGEPLEVALEILSWEGATGNSTATANVTVLSEDFYMPQLDRYRRISVYLPPDYGQTEEAYPVLYMQDGQNVFDDATAAFGEWEVDESLNSLYEAGGRGVIVVAIDHGGTARLDEYSPWTHPQYGGGEGEAYVNFIVETLKPYIDQEFRTLPGREHTGIMGSSMGGLIALYAAIEHQDVFSKAGVFSASFWFAEECYSHVATTGKMADMRIYLIAGEQEGDSGQQVADMEAMYDTLRFAGFSEAEVVRHAHADGAHSEWYWRREFPDAYEWLYATAVSGSNAIGLAFLSEVTVYPNPGSGLFQVELPRWLPGLEAQVFSAEGKRLQHLAVESQSWTLPHLPRGAFCIRFSYGGRLIGTKWLISQ